LKLIRLLPLRIGLLGAAFGKGGKQSFLQRFFRPAFLIGSEEIAEIFTGVAVIAAAHLFCKVLL
ncbi:MAG TPA: hypothetical protein VL346_12670, partial [Acidobacteriaceae bacterium]|nr:hypothetical protein [Acidobacteriaceae bacterium]